MEDFSAEEEEPWYDQQDLEQGEHGGGGRESGVRPATLSASPLLGGITPGRVGLDPARRTPRDDACGEWGRGGKGRCPGDPDRTRRDLQKSGERTSFSPEGQGHTSPSLPTPT